MEHNINKIFYLTLLLSLPFFLTAQKKEITLQYEILDIPNPNIYIESVVDGRINQKFIGVVFHREKRDSIELKGGITSINNYLKFNLPRDTNKIPIVILVTDISIFEYKTEVSDSIKAKVALIFYQGDISNLNKKYETEVFLSKENNDGLKGFERILRDCIGKCFTDFIYSNSSVYQSQSGQRKINQPNQYTARTKDNPVSLTSKKNKNSYFLTYTNMQGVTAKGFSISFYSFRNRDSANWVFPIQLSIESMNIRSDFFRKTGYYSAKLNYYMPGISVIRKFNKYLFFNMGIEVAVGSEVLKKFGYEESYNEIFGVSLSQKLSLVLNSYNLVFGIGFYERKLSSLVYPFDIGVKFEVGMTF